MPPNSHLFCQARQEDGRRRIGTHGAARPSVPTVRLFVVPPSGGIPSESNLEKSPKGPEYLDLLDWTGRQGRKGRHGKIPARVAPILSRLGIEGSMWCDFVWNFKKYFGGRAGSPKSLKSEV